MFKKNKMQLYFFFPCPSVGGVEKNFKIISNYLSEFYNNVFLVTYSKSFKKYLNKKIKIINPNLNLSFIPRRIKFLYAAILMFKNTNKKNSIIFSFQGNFYLLLLSFFFKRKIIIRSNTSPEGWAKNIFKKALFRLLLKRAKIITVNSQEFSKIFYKFFLIKPFLIRNPLDTDVIKKKSKIKSNNISIFKKNTINLINIGRLVDQKNQILILKSLISAKNTKVRLLIIGTGPMKKFLKNFIKKKKLNKYVKIIKENHNPHKYLIQSDALILCSKYEGFPNVILEAMVLKKFIISSDCPTGPKEILKKKKYSILFKNNNISSLTCVIKKLQKKQLVCKENFKNINNDLKPFNPNKLLIEYKKILNHLSK